MATVWDDDDTSKSDHNIEEKTWNCLCVVKPNDETFDTNDNVRTKTNAVHMKRDTLTSECARSLLVRSCCDHLHSLHTTSSGSSFARVSSHPCKKWASLFDSELSIPSNFLFSLFIFIFPQLLLLFYFHEVSGRTGYFAKKEMRSTDESYSLTGYDPPFSEQRFFEDVDYDDAALEEMLHNAHRVNVYRFLREGLSVGQSSSVSEWTWRPVVERTGRLVVERGQELNAEHAQIRNFFGPTERANPRQLPGGDWEIRKPD